MIASTTCWNGESCARCSTRYIGQWKWTFIVIVVEGHQVGKVGPLCERCVANGVTITMEDAK